MFAKFGTSIGAKLLYNMGALFQALSSLAFGLLDYTDNVN
jgi:hypothetical protein